MNPPTPTRQITLTDIVTHEEPGPGLDPTICPICYESHRTRWNTTCGHTVCIECWRSISRTHQRTEVACPICRTLTDITELVTPFVSHSRHIHHYQTHRQFLSICLQAYRYYLEQRYTHILRRESPYDVTHINPDPSTARIAIQRGEEYLIMFPWPSLYLWVECTHTTRNSARMKIHRCIKEHLVLSGHHGRSFCYTFDRPCVISQESNSWSMNLDDMDVLSYYTMIYSDDYVQWCLSHELCMIFVFPSRR